MGWIQVLGPVLPALLLVIAHFATTVRAQQSPRLAFRSDKTFKVVVFADMHFGEANDKDQDSLLLQRNVLDAEQPDMVVFTGDLVSGWRGHKKKGWMEQMMRTILEYPNSQGYPHAIALGNHDAEANLGRVAVLKEDRAISGDLSYSQIGPEDITGASNYYVDIYSGVSGHSDRVDLRLWFFDSMGRGCEGNSSSWGCVGRDTVEWYSDLSAELVPVEQQIAFVHMCVIVSTSPACLSSHSPHSPLSSCTQALTPSSTARASSPLPEHRLGYGDFRSLDGRQEDSACPTVNTGLATVLALNGVNMVVSGHDHQNDFAGNIHLAHGETGIAEDGNGLFSPGSGSRDDGDLPLLMAYGRKSGYGSYGPGAINRGARVIQFHTFTSAEEEQFQTQRLANSLRPSTYYGLPPQFMHGGSFKWMETWVTDYKGAREPSTRPIYKYQVQEMCYSAAQGIRSVYATVLILAFVLVGAELF